MPELAQGNAPKKTYGKFTRGLWNYFVRPLVQMQGYDAPELGKEGFTEQKALEFVESLPDNIREPLNEYVDLIRGQLGNLTEELPEVSFAELENINPGLIPTPENLEKFIPNLAQADFAPIAAEAQRRFNQETVPGIMERLTGLGQTGRSSSFQGALGKAGADLQSKLAALESAHNLQKGQLQLGQGELAGNLYGKATQRAGTLGGLQTDIGRLGIQQGEALGQLRLGQQRNQLERQNMLLSGLTGQMNRPVVGYEPQNKSPFYQFGQEMKPLVQQAVKAAIMAAV